MYLVRIGLLVGLLLPMACIASTVRGTVTLPGGVGLPDALITVVQVGGELGPWTGKTGPNGTYSISDPLIFGNLEVSVSRPKTLFFPTSREFFDGGASTITADFSGFTNSPIDATSIQISRAGVTFDSGANPLGLPTTAFFEYGIAPALDYQSPPVALSGTSRQSARFSLVPVPSVGSVVQARLVATNALGRSEGPLQQFVVPFQQFTTRFTAQGAQGAPLWSLLAADFNRDARMDFIWLSGSSFNENPPFIGTGPDSWSHSTLCLDCMGVPIQTAVVLDHNHDNKPDLLIAHEFGDFQIVQQDKPDGGFNQILPEFGAVSFVTRQQTIDFDRDGRDDLVQQGFFFSVMVQSASADFITLIGDPRYRNQNAVAGDLNGDGFPDIVFSGMDVDGQPSLFRLFWDKERGLPGVDPSVLLAHLSGVQATEVGLSLADLDGNGTLDILSLARIDGDRLRLEIYWNDGGGNFADRHVSEVRSKVTWVTPPAMLTSGDFDNDGLEDVLLSGAPCLLISAPKRSVRIVSKPELSPLVGEAIRFDADGDGRLDLLVMGVTAEGLMSAQVMRNNIVAQNRAPAAPVTLQAIPNTNRVRFEWDAGAGDDLTPASALTWNIRVGTRPGGTDVVSPLSDLSTGRRYVLNPGNAGLGRFFDLSLPKAVTHLFWSVQAVDAGYLGGAWAPEQVVHFSAGQPFRLTEVRFDANGTVRLRGLGDGQGAILNRSEDLIHWTPVGPFEADGDAFQAIDSAPLASGGRYYSAR